VEEEHPRPLVDIWRHPRAASKRGWRYATARFRPMPGVIIIGAQRGGTTSLHTWLCSHPAVTPFAYPEIHYFDVDYDKGERWYRAHYPIGRRSGINVESSPYMLFHPLAPGRAARDLPKDTRFVVLLRDPVERAISHYWHERRLGFETESLEAALRLEDGRLAGQDEIVRAGGRSVSHRHFSYRARGRYADQLRRWFDALGTSRMLVVESEELFVQPEVSAGVLEWLALTRFEVPFPATNDAPRGQSTDGAIVDALRREFAPFDEDLFDLLGRRLWGR
jgi:hypothetical protein